MKFSEEQIRAVKLCVRHGQITEPRDHAGPPVATGTWRSLERAGFIKWREDDWGRGYRLTARGHAWVAVMMERASW